eukprot:5990853-Alexandrium_andersonii.AAC.1
MALSNVARVRVSSSHGGMFIPGRTAGTPLTGQTPVGYFIRREVACACLKPSETVLSGAEAVEEGLRAGRRIVQNCIRVSERCHAWVTI